MDKIYIAFFTIALIVFLIDIVYMIKHKKIEVVLKRIEDSISRIISLVDHKSSDNSTDKKS